MNHRTQQLQALVSAVLQLRNSQSLTATEYSTSWRIWEAQANAALAMPPHDWHSMDTAPKNGREVLLFLDVGPHHYQHRVVGSWSDEQACFIDWCNEPIELNMSNQITGWTELPAPPTFEGAAK
jgi:hypothetical protein